MENIPVVVFEQAERAEIPRCPFPCFEQEGEAIAGVWSYLASRVPHAIVGGIVEQGGWYDPHIRAA